MTPRPHHPLARWGVALVAVVALLAAGCGSDDDGDATGPDTTAPAATDVGGEEEATETLRVVVTNDDGYDAGGIDTLVEALVEWGAEVHVVAPLEQRSGTGGTFVDGPVETEEVTTASGQEAIAVDGFPADTVRVAVDELGLEPHLVVSGMNEGQNLGGIIDVSGTVGAARAAVARGIPALAFSAGHTDEESAQGAYDEGARIMIEWIEENLDALLAGEAVVEAVSINVPACTVGEVRGLVEVPLTSDGEVLRTEQDCTSTLEDPADDAEAFNNGFAALTVVPDEPETPPEPGTP